MNIEVLNQITTDLTNEINAGMTDPRIREAAYQFMKDNYTRIDERSKTMAIDEIECNEYFHETYPESLLTAFMSAIATLENEQ